MHLWAGFTGRPFELSSHSRDTPPDFYKAHCGLGGRELIRRRRGLQGEAPGVSMGQAPGWGGGVVHGFLISNGRGIPATTECPLVICKTDRKGLTFMEWMSWHGQTQIPKPGSLNHWGGLEKSWNQLPEKLWREGRHGVPA